MAWVDVEIPENQFDGPLPPFKNLNAIGDSVIGFYVSKRPSKYEGKSNYTVLTTTGLVTYSPSAHAQQGLNEAEKKGILKPGCKVAVKVTGSRDIGKAYPMQTVQVRVDPDIAPNFAELVKKAQAELAKTQAKPAAAAAADDDIPF